MGLGLSSAGGATKSTSTMFGSAREAMASLEITGIAAACSIAESRKAMFKDWSFTTDALSFPL
jgi:hypothetical protein